MISGRPMASRDVLGQRGLAGAGRAVEAQRAVAARLERLDDARDLEAALDVEHVEVVGGDAAARAQAVRRAQREVGIAQLALDQALDRSAFGHGQPREAHRGADLRRREALAAGQLGGEGLGHGDAFERLAHQLLARAGRRRLELQVVGEAAPEGRVDLLDAVGDPERGHGIRFEDLVDPGLAAHAAAGGGGDLLGARHELGGLGADRREHVLDLVEQQRRLRAALEEDLRDLQRAVAVAARERVAVAVGVLDLEQLQARGLRHHLGELGLAGAGRAVEQHVDARLLARHRGAQQGDEHLRVFLDECEVVHRERALGRGPREHGHQLVVVAVLAHQHRRQLLADLHQVGQVGDVVLGDQVLDQADALQPRAGAQRLAHVAGIDAGDLGDRGIGLGRVVDLELDQQRAQVALVARQRAVEQQRALGLVELQQAGERVDVLLDQGRLLAQRMGEPVARDRQHGEQVLRLVLGVFVEVEEQRAFLVGAAPDAVALQQRAAVEVLDALPDLVARAAAAEEFAQALQHRQRPDQVAAGQREQAVEVAPHVEARALLGRQREHEVRAHELEHRRFLESGRRQCVTAGSRGHDIDTGTLDHRATLQLGELESERDHSAEFWLREDSETVKTRMLRFRPQCRPCLESTTSNAPPSACAGRCSTRPAWNRARCPRSSARRCSSSSRTCSSRPRSRSAAPATSWSTCRRTGVRGVIAMSAGNHAQGVAYHAQRLGLRALIVMPRFTPGREDRAHPRLRRRGGAARRHAGRGARPCAGAGGAAKAWPSSTPTTTRRSSPARARWRSRCWTRCRELDTLVVSVGGGGLIAGMAMAARARKPGIEIVGVQTAALPDHGQRRAGHAPSAGREHHRRGHRRRHAGRADAGHHRARRSTTCCWSTRATSSRRC